MELREYQKETLAEILSKLSMDRPLVVSADTGFGKSLVIGRLAYHFIEQGQKVLVLQPNKELLEQNLEKAKSYGLEPKVFSASLGIKELGGLVYATLGSIKAVDNLDFDVLILDEADVSYTVEDMDKTFGRFLLDNRVKGNFRYVVGFTATPYRLHTTSNRFTYEVKTTTKMLTNLPIKAMKRNRGRITPEQVKRMRAKSLYGSKFWKEIVVGKNLKELIQDGYLTPLKYYKLDHRPYTRGLKANSTGADYDKASISEYGLKIIEVLERLVYKVLEDSKRTLIFAPDIVSAEMVVERLQAAGVKAGVIHSKMGKKERKKVLDDFKERKLTVLANVEILTAGFDDPDLDSIILARPSMSIRLYKQMIGRVVRLGNKEFGKVYDMAGLVDTFGTAENIFVDGDLYGGWKLYYNKYGTPERVDEKILGTFVLNQSEKKIKKQERKNLLWGNE